MNDVDPERKIIKAPKAGDKASKEAIELWTKVSVGKYYITVSL